MDVKDFCSAMDSEMTSWKAKMYDAMRKIDNLGTAEKEKMLMNIQDLNMLKGIARQSGARVVLGPEMIALDQ